MVAVDFSPRMRSIVITRRGATVDPTVPIDRSAVAPRRRIVFWASVRGLKPTATIVVSLRETARECPTFRAAACPRGPKPRRTVDCGGTTPLLLHAWSAS